MSQWNPWRLAVIVMGLMRDGRILFRQTALRLARGDLETYRATLGEVSR